MDILLLKNRRKKTIKIKKKNIDLKFFAYMKRLDSKSLRKFMELVFGFFFVVWFFFLKPDTSIEIYETNNND